MTAFDPPPPLWQRVLSWAFWGAAYVAGIYGGACFGQWIGRMLGA